MNPKRFTVTLETCPSDIPAAARLKQALKVLLRGFKLRCVTLVESQPETDARGSTENARKGEA